MKLKKVIFIFLFFGLSFVQAQKENNISIRDTLVVGYNINAPFIFKDNDELNGIVYKMWQDITKNDKNIYKLEYHPLDSLLLGLSNGSIDIGLSPLTINHNRIENIDFSVPYYVSNSTVLVKKLNFKQKISRFLAGINILNLLRILGFLLILLAVFGFLVWIFERKKNKDFGEGIHGFWNGLWWSAVTMTTVGYGDKSPKTVGGRVVGLIWMFSAIILISSVTAGITSSLTVKKLGWDNSDFTDFKAITIGTISKSATEQRLMDNNWSNFKSYHTLNELLSALENNEVQAVTHDEPILRYALNNNDTFKDFNFLNIKYNQSLYAMGFSRSLDAGIKHKLSKKILNFTESNDWKILLSRYSLMNDQNLILSLK